MRTLLNLLLLLFLSSTAQSQIYAVSFKEAKDARKYKNHLVLINGEQLVVGEAKYAIYVEDNSIKYAGSGRNELWVADSGDPSFVPYKYKGEERVPTNPKGVLEIRGEEIKNIRVLIREQSLLGLAEEYRERLARIQELAAERDASPKASPQWFMAHQRMLSNYERLQKWMASTCFPDAAKKLDKEIERQKKNVAADALAERLSKARSTIRMVDTPSDLVALSQSISAGKLAFKVQESMHIRIVYRTEISDERIKALLEFGEEAIDGFRGDCVDPYLDVDFEDKIPDRIFAEFWFGPEDETEYDRYATEYYRHKWGDHKAESLKMGGAAIIRALPPEAVHYWKFRDDVDLEGLVAHGLGHDLALLHYNFSLTKPANQDWLLEGAAFYLSLEFFGRNNVTCKAFKETHYVHEKKKEGERDLRLGMRDFYNSLALELGPPIDKLATKDLYALDEPDVAKSWSFFDFLAKEEGKRGQLFLRAACVASKEKTTFIQKWREATNAIYEFGDGDVFKAIDQRWREFAESGQELGETARRKH